MSCIRKSKFIKCTKLPFSGNNVTVILVFAIMFKVSESYKSPLFTRNAPGFVFTTEHKPVAASDGHAVQNLEPHRDIRTMCLF